MNIALFASAFHPHFGGVEELCRQLAHSYRDKGHKVIVLTNQWPRNLPARETFEGLSIYRFPFRVPEGTVRAHLNYHLTSGSICRQMYDLLRQHQIDVLHVQCISTNGYYALHAKEALGLPLVVTAQGELTMDAGGLYQKPTFMNRYLPTLLKKADYITGCSAKTLSDVFNHIGVAYPEKSRAIFNGVNLNDFDGGDTYLHPRPYILGIGRLVPQKGFDLLIRAFAQSSIKSHDVLIAGDGSERPELEKLAQSLGIQDRIHFLGRADRPLAVSLFRGASFVALPSRADEGLPVVTVETMAAGKAIAAARVGGVPESVLDGETGIIFGRENVEELTRAIELLALDSTLREQFGNAARRRATSFTWPVIADQYLSIYGIVSKKVVPTSLEAKPCHV